jgi:hypothetical protein
MRHQSGKDEDLQIINRLRVEKQASLTLPVAGGLIGSADRKPAERRLTTL